MVEEEESKPSECTSLQVRFRSARPPALNAECPLEAMCILPTLYQSLKSTKYALYCCVHGKTRRV